MRAPDAAAPAGQGGPLFHRLPCLTSPSPASPAPPVSRLPQTAVGRVAPGATGFRWRKALWCSQLSDRWKTAAEAAVGVANLERANAVFAPIFGLQSYVNYLEDSLPLEAFYGANLPWLRRVKRRWDPEGYFSTNALSIPPARADGRRDS